jgi:branched-subunit amino acid transport protein
VTETIAAMAVVTFLTRAVGLMGVPIRKAWAIRVLTLVPAAAFAALVSANLDLRPDAWFRWLVVGVGGWLSWRGTPVWACVGGGLAVYFIGAVLFK